MKLKELIEELKKYEQEVDVECEIRVKEKIRGQWIWISEQKPKGTY